jgi:hypothetical protein
VSDLPPDWNLIEYYRRRYPIEALFNEYKSSGRQWEKGQVKDPEHMERLWVGMALATWVVFCIGSQVSQEILSKPSSGKRCPRLYEGKFSLFALALERLLHCLTSDLCFQPYWLLVDWDKNNWQTQIRTYHALSFVWA